MTPWWWSRPEALGAALAWAAGVALAQPAGAPPASARDAAACESVVMVRCERPAAAPPPSPRRDAARGVDQRRADQRRVDQRRRAFNQPLDLDRIIIEADPLKRSVEDVIDDALVSRPPGGTYTYTTAEGSQCSCMNRCPPIPFPCCQCAPHPSTYTRSPGAYPLR